MEVRHGIFGGSQWDGQMDQPGRIPEDPKQGGHTVLSEGKHNHATSRAQGTSTAMAVYDVSAASRALKMGT